MRHSFTAGIDYQILSIDEDEDENGDEYPPKLALDLASGECKEIVAEWIQNNGSKLAMSK
jgi:hypothetical protein